MFNINKTCFEDELKHDLRKMYRFHSYIVQQLDLCGPVLLCHSSVQTSLCLSSVFTKSSNEWTPLLTGFWLPHPSKHINFFLYHSSNVSSSSWTSFLIILSSVLLSLWPGRPYDVYAKFVLCRMCASVLQRYSFPFFFVVFLFYLKFLFVKVHDSIAYIMTSWYDIYQLLQSGNVSVYNDFLKQNIDYQIMTISPLSFFFSTEHLTLLNLSFSLRKHVSLTTFFYVILTLVIFVSILIQSICDCSSILCDCSNIFCKLSRFCVMTTTSFDYRLNYLIVLCYSNETV